jgi:hypothetical protein
VEHLGVGNRDKHGFLGMQSVLSLLENGIRMSLENFFADLFAAISRQAVEHDVVWGGVFEQI